MPWRRLPSEVAAASGGEALLAQALARGTKMCGSDNLAVLVMVEAVQASVLSSSVKPLHRRAEEDHHRKHDPRAPAPAERGVRVLVVVLFLLARGGPPRRRDGLLPPRGANRRRRGVVRVEESSVPIYLPKVSQ